MFLLVLMILAAFRALIAYSYGRIAPTYTTGTTLMAAAGPLSDLKAKIGGITLDWTTVAAVSGSAATFLDGTVVPVGQQALALGQVVCKITASGKYGPYDSGASDGRQLLVRGDCFILNETILMTPPMGLGALQTQHPAVYEGGAFFKDRVLVVGGQAATYLGATTRVALASFETVFPLVRWVNATS